MRTDPTKYERDLQRRVTGVLLLLATLIPCAADAGTRALAFAGGVDYYADSNEQLTRAVLALGTARFGSADAFGAAVRYDNDAAGPGNGFVVGFGVPVRPLLTQLRATAPA